MTERTLAPALALAAIILSGVGIAAFATDHPEQGGAPVAAAGEMVDSALNDRVETTLKTDPGLAGTRLQVATRGGIVTLGGTVPDEHSLRRVLDLASDVKGVREVRSTMAIEPVVK